MAGEHIAKRRIFPTRNKHREVFFLRRNHPAVFGINLEAGLEFFGIQNTPKKLVRKKSLALRIGSHPLAKDHIFNASHRFHLRDTSIRHPIHVPVE